MTRAMCLIFMLFVTAGCSSKWEPVEKVSDVGVVVQVRGIAGAWNSVDITEVTTTKGVYFLSFLQSVPLGDSASVWIIDTGSHAYGKTECLVIGKRAWRIR